MIIKLGNYYINPKYITSVNDDPHFVYTHNGEVGRFIVTTLRNDEELYIPYSTMPFDKFFSEWKFGL
jgi:hypothetical protein